MASQEAPGTPPGPMRTATLKNRVAVHPVPGTFGGLEEGPRRPLASPQEAPERLRKPRPSPEALFPEAFEDPRTRVYSYPVFEGSCTHGSEGRWVGGRGGSQGLPGMPWGLLGRCWGPRGPPLGPLKPLERAGTATLILRVAVPTVPHGSGGGFQGLPGMPGCLLGRCWGPRGPPLRPRGPPQGPDPRQGWLRTPRATPGGTP